MFSFPVSLPLVLVVLLLCFNSLSHAREQRKLPNANFIHDVDVNSLLDLPCKHSSTLTGKKEGLVSLEVVHRPRSDMKSPFHPDMLLLDQERVDSIHARLSGQSVAGEDKAAKPESDSADLSAQSGVSMGTANYIVSVGLGTPQKKLSLVFDTGSDVTWTNCRKEGFFIPASSSSFVSISCGADACTVDLNAAGVGSGCSSTCMYSITYADKSSSNGFLVKDRLTLTSDYSIDDFVFGCGVKMRGMLKGSTGLIGLGRTQLSLVSQAANKYGHYFSYCLPSTACSLGHLTLGHPGANTPAHFSYTPLLPNDNAHNSFYFLDLQYISVAGRNISMVSAAGTIIDSGTVFSSLPPTAFSALRTAFMQSMSNYPSFNVSHKSFLHTCFDLSKYKTVSVPKVTLYFRGGGVLDLPATGILASYGDPMPKVMCLAFTHNKYDDEEAVVGNFQQKGFDVVYDVAGGNIGFGPGGC